jgi:hypothetical protein
LHGHGNAVPAMIRKVSFLGRQPELASTRYRVVIPAMALQKLGVEVCKDADVIVYAKDKVDPDILARFKATVYDVCDDNFDCAVRGEEYRRHVAKANAVTCNSDMMRFLIHKKCDRIATVIPDPYEREEWAPSWGEGLLWFGHQVNVKDLVRVMPRLTDTVTALTHDTDKVAFTEWSQPAMDEHLRSCSMVIIPTGRGAHKSANRMIESVRAGKFVVAEPLPAYEEFSRWMWVGDLAEGVKWAKQNRSECLIRVRECQRWIRERFNPQRIGRLWLKVLNSI